jgi:hypothetical protein
MAAAPNPAVAALLGVWEDPTTVSRTRFTIEVQGGVPVVISGVGSVNDHERLVIRSSSWNGNSLTWVYFVPSTGYVVTNATIAAQGDRLSVRWSNSAGASGSADLIRVGGPAAVGGNAAVIDQLLTQQPVAPAPGSAPSGSPVGAWTWQSDVQVFRADGSGTYYRDGGVCYEFRFVVQGDVFTETADRDSGCSAKRQNSYRFRFEGGQMVMTHTGSGYESHWQSTQAP